MYKISKRGEIWILSENSLNLAVSQSQSVLLDIVKHAKIRKIPITEAIEKFRENVIVLSN